MASTYDGGSEITKGQLTIDRGDAFGTGPVTVGTTGMAALMVRNRDVTIPNKVVFNRSDAYAVGFGDTLGSLTLKSIGTGSSLYKTVRLGREGAGSVGRVTLSLTDPDSEAVRQFGLQGAVRLRLDGGTVKARADAENPFFRVVTAGDAADITVAANGVAFDVPADSTLELGQPLAFESAVATNVVGACAPENASFEDGLTGGWMYTTLVGGEDGSGIKQTPCPWDGNGEFKPHGGKFAMVRQGVRLSTAVPEDCDIRGVLASQERPGERKAHHQFLSVSPRQTRIAPPHGRLGAFGKGHYRTPSVRGCDSFGFVVYRLALRHVQAWSRLPYGLRAAALRAVFHTVPLDILQEHR